MVKQRKSRHTWLRLSLLIGIALSGVHQAQAQHAFEYAARLGANAFLYTSDYGKMMPNYNVGMDFSYKYRSPYHVGVRIGAGIDVAAGTYVGTGGTTADGALIGYADNYHVPNQLDFNNMSVDVNYQLGKFTETQQQIIASVPIQFGLFFGDFSMFLGVRGGYVVHGCYWQRMQNNNLWLYYRQTGVTVGQDMTGKMTGGIAEHPEAYAIDEWTNAGMYERTVNGIKPLSRGAMPWYYITGIVDINYSFKVGDNTDFAIGLYAEYDPLGYKPAVTNSTSLMMWTYDPNPVKMTPQGLPVYERRFGSVLESNRADGADVRGAEDFEGTPIVKKYHRASAGIRFTVSLWSVPIDNGKNYRKQQRFMNDCLCDFW